MSTRLSLLAAALAAGVACGWAADVQDPSAPGCDTGALQEATLRLLNQQRRAGADCGSSGRFAPAPPLHWDARLQRAAASHAAEVAQSGRLEHRSSDGRDGGDRLRAAGYAHSLWAENLAAGHADVAEVVQAWLASPAHCGNLLNPRLQQVGLACRAGQTVRVGPGLVWVLDLARPLHDFQR